VKRRPSDRPADPPRDEADLRQSPFKAALSGWKKTETTAARSMPSIQTRTSIAPLAKSSPVKPARTAAAAADDAAMFRWAMDGVTPMAKRHEGREPEPVERTIVEVDEDAEALALLAELVAGDGTIDLSDTDEYVEGLVRGVDPSLLVPLRRGEFSVQAHVDLHGLLVADARDTVERFLVESRRRGHRCVLVVHGRGLHSKDQIPVIKERLGVWLSRGRLSRIVLAFCTARPVDGGAGALYVLLRR